jgi:Tfp pilus assembly protein PilV
VNSRVSCITSNPLRTDSGVTLVEVLMAIFVTGVGLLALLALFPIGAMDMAAAIKDDRAAAIAAQATQFSQTAENVVLKTRDFIQESLLKGAVDRDAAGALQDEYQLLTVQALDIELQIGELESALPRWQIARYAAPLKAQIREIAKRTRQMILLFGLLDGSQSPPSDSF